VSRRQYTCFSVLFGDEINVKLISDFVATIAGVHKDVIVVMHYFSI